MQQTSYVLTKDLNFTDYAINAKAGDVFIFTPPEKLVVYRNGELLMTPRGAAVMGTSQAAINGLVISGVLRRQTDVVAAIVAEVDVPAERVEASLAQAAAGQTIPMEEVAAKLEAEAPGTDTAPEEAPGTDTAPEAPADSEPVPEEAPEAPVEPTVPDATPNTEEVAAQEETTAAAKAKKAAPKAKKPSTK